MNVSTNKKGITIFAAVVIVVLIGVGFFVARLGSSSKQEMLKEGSERVSSKEVIQEDLSVKAESTDATALLLKEKGTDPSYRGLVLAGGTSPLLDFNKGDYEKAKNSEKLIVLYFYANWCPLCKAETMAATYQAFNELTGDHVVGFRVNYNDSDTDADEKALAREFGVGYQHTKVFLKGGKRILKSPEGWNKERYLSEITKAQ